MQMVDSGRLATLGEMIERGALGFVRGEAGADVTQQVWTIATGFPEDVHGVPGPYAVMPEETGIYPIGRGDSRCLPFWEVSARQGLRSCALAWPGTRDSDEENLCVVTEDIAVALGPDRFSWPIMPGTATDRDMDAALFALRVHPTEITADDLEFFAPGLSGPPLRRALAQAIASAATVQAAAMHVLGTRSFRVVAVHYDFLDRIRRLHSRAPQHFPITVIAKAYRFFDALLANLRHALPEHCTLILATVPARESAECVVPGVLLLEGPNVKPDALIGDAQLADIAPTALHCAGGAVPQSWLPLPWKSAYKTGTPVETCSMDLIDPPQQLESAWQQVQHLGFRARIPLAPFRRQIEQLAAKARRTPRQH